MNMMMLMVSVLGVIVVAIGLLVRAARLNRAAKLSAAARFACRDISWASIETDALRAEANVVDAGVRDLNTLFPSPTSMPIEEHQRCGGDLAVVIGETLVSVVPYVWKAATIDPAVFAAVQHLTHEAVDSVGSLASATDDWPGIGAWGPTEALIRKLKGHVGEWMAASHLEAAGHEVRLELLSNAEGQDLWVDGHPFNIKTVRDAAAEANKALRDYPNVAVIVPGDADRLPPEATHFDADHPIDPEALVGGGVFVDHSLSVSEATSVTEDALDAASGHVGMGVPWITAARSTFRELKLWNHGHQDLGRTAKNVAVDVTLMGGGAKAGAVLGAKVGTLFGPGFGTAIGAAVGGVLGGMLGRAKAREIREAPLHEARAVYEQQTRIYDANRTDTIERAIAAWNARVAVVESELARERDRTKVAIAVAVAETETCLARQVELSPSQRHEMLAASRHTIVAELDEAVSQISRAGWWARFWPNKQFADTRAAVPYMRTEIVSLDVLTDLTENGPDAEFLAMLARTTSGQVVATNHARRVASLRVTAISAVEHSANAMLSALTANRNAVVRELKNEHARMMADTESRVHELSGPLRAAREKLLAELRRAGVDVEQMG